MPVRRVLLFVLLPSLLWLTPAAAQSEDPSGLIVEDQEAPAVVVDMSADAWPTDGVPTATEQSVSPLPTRDATPAVTPVPAPAVRATLTKLAAGTGELLPNPSHHFGPTGYDNSAEAMNQIPSPVGAPLFNDVWFPIGGQSFHEMRLAPPEWATYSFSCATALCVGSAEMVWRAMPTWQQQAYLSALVHAAQDNQTWNPKIFNVTVRVGAGGPMLACAQLTNDNPAVTFPDHCP